MILLAREGHGLNHHAHPIVFLSVRKSKPLRARHDYLFVVEQNRDAQMRHLLVAETDISARKLLPILNYDGMPLTAAFVHDAVLNLFAEYEDIAEACATPITAA